MKYVYHQIILWLFRLFLSKVFNRFLNWLFVHFFFLIIICRMDYYFFVFNYSTIYLFFRICAFMCLREFILLFIAPHRFSFYNLNFYVFDLNEFEYFAYLINLVIYELICWFHGFYFITSEIFQILIFELFLNYNCYNIIIFHELMLNMNYIFLIILGTFSLGSAADGLWRLTLSNEVLYESWTKGHLYFFNLDMFY